MPLIEPGQRAPAFTLADQQGKKHSLKDYAGRVVVLYFYPKDDTPGCTIQACGFRDALPRFDTIDAVVLGVSPDDSQSHAAFVEKFDLNFTLLADVPDDRGVPPVCDKYGVWQEKQMAGKTFMGVMRTTYLIGPDGKIVRRWDKVKVENHADEVLAAINELQSRV